MMEIGGVGSVNGSRRRGKQGVFAPRLGVAAAQADGRARRYAYGDPFALIRPMGRNYPVQLILVVRARNSFAFASRLEDGIPQVPIPDLGNGSFPVPGNFTVTTLPLEFDRGYVESWNVMFQRQLRWSFIGEVGYVGTRQVDQQ